MALLPHKQILGLHAAVVSSQLTSSRTVLLGGIDPSFADGLPVCASPSAQILSDLHGLNAAAALGDGTVPFSIWLGNALALAGERVEAQVFHCALDRIEGGGGREEPCLPPKDDDISMKLSKIARAVLLGRGEDLMWRLFFEVEELLTRFPQHAEARMLRERIRRAVVKEEQSRPRALGVSARAGTSAFGPPPDAAKAMPRWSPPLPHHFVGRLREMTELLDRSGPAGVAISGLIGVGKTALAHRLNDALRSSYPDLQRTFDLRGTSPSPSSSAVVMAEIIHTYLPMIRLPDRGEGLTGMYRAVLVGQRALLFLDDALDRAQVEPLLPPPGSALIITSRRRFDLSGVHSLSIEGLENEDAAALLRNLASRIDDREAGVIADLVGGSPFALSLAGRALSRRPELTVDAYAERLRGALSRSALIDAALDVNFDLLDAVPQALWCRLGGYPAAFTTAIASRLSALGSRRTHEVLHELTAHGMVENDASSELYRLSDAAQRSALSRLHVTERADAERLHEQIVAQATEGQEAAPTWLPEDTLEAALGVAHRVGQSAAEIYYLQRLAMIHAGAGRLRRAVERLEQALPLVRKLGDPEGERAVLAFLEEIQHHLKA